MTTPPARSVTTPGTLNRVPQGPDQAFPVPDTEDNYFAKQGRFWYWRKHANLQGWMSAAYIAKKRLAEWMDNPSEASGDGIQWGSLATGNLLLTAEIIDKLEWDMDCGEMPFTTGFFFGKTRPSDEQETRAFITAARQALNQGRYLVYEASW